MRTEHDATAPRHNETESEIQTQTQTQALNSAMYNVFLFVIVVVMFGSIFSTTKDERLSIGLHILHEAV